MSLVFNGQKHVQVSEPEHNDQEPPPAPDAAATRIQTAFRGKQARRTLYSLKNTGRLEAFVQKQSVRKRNQANNTLVNLQMWRRVGSQITNRRLCMVTQGRIKQKKLETQLKVEAKLHEIQADWCGGSETMEDTIARIHQREEASVKRERAMAYAFSHQWRVNSGTNNGQSLYEFGNGVDWGWSWMERWTAARPWEPRGMHNDDKKTGGRIEKKTPRISKQQPNKTSTVVGS